MNYKNLIIVILLVLNLFIDVKIYSKVVSWSFSKPYSLLLTDTQGVMESNMSFIMDTNNTTNRIKIEDIVLDNEFQFSTLFTRFQKKRFSSFIKVKVYDVFTDNKLLELDFYEQEVKSIRNTQINKERVYLVIELYGNDIELRSVGMEMIKQSCIEEDEFKLNSTLLNAQTDNLEITTVFKEAVKVTMFVYNRQGDICKEILIKKVLDPGTYKFALDPKELSFDYFSDKTYYVWLKAENHQSNPVELVKTFQVIP